MNLLLFCFYVLSANPALDSSQSRTVSIDPVKDRGAIRLAVHLDRPSLVVFDRAPDAKMITSDDSRWYISTPGNGLPDHAFHFKPKTSKAGVGNAFFFFDGYPIEVVYESTDAIAKATTLLYVVVQKQSPNRTERLELDALKPKVSSTSAPKYINPMNLFNPITYKPVTGDGPDLRLFHKEKRTNYGVIRWSTDRGTVYFQPNPDMANLMSLEVVRGRKGFGTKIFDYAHPLQATLQQLAGGQLLDFNLIHLSRKEHYYLRLFFEGSREPVLIRLKGLGMVKKQGRWRLK